MVSKSPEFSRGRRLIQNLTYIVLTLLYKATVGNEGQRHLLYLISIYITMGLLYGGEEICSKKLFLSSFTRRPNARCREKLCNKLKVICLHCVLLQRTCTIYPKESCPFAKQTSNSPLFFGTSNEIIERTPRRYTQHFI